MLSQARTDQFTSLDPQVQFEQTSADLTLILYSTLLSYSYLERPYKLVPGLLAKMPELSADKLSIVSMCVALVATRWVGIMRLVRERRQGRGHPDLPRAGRPGRRQLGAS